MPNLGFQLEVLKQVVAERAAGGDSLAIKIGQSNFDNPLMQFAVLGAMGPDVLRYVPISSKLASFLSGLVPSATSGTTMTTSQVTTAVANATGAMSALTAVTATPAQQELAMELYFNPFGAAYSVLFSALVVPVWPILNHATDVLDQLDAIVAEQDEIALAGMIGTIQSLEGLQTQLAGLSGTIPVLEAVIGGIIAQGPWMEMDETLVSPADPVLNRRFEFLRWHHSGRFTQNLVEGATSDNQKAFAFGWQCHVAASVTSEPFINNIVGGPYRTHWWRNRLASNFVDSWTFGFFEQGPLPTMSGDDPTPGYFDPMTGNGWPSICSANLQKMFNVANLAGPSTPDGVPDAVMAMATGNISSLLSSSPFPTEISTLLSDAMGATYTAPLGSALFPSLKLPIAGLTSGIVPVPAFNANTFASAYIGAFAVYWFMTSSSGVVGMPTPGTPTGQPEPAWLASGGSPSPSQAGVNVGAAICAAILAIIGVVLLATGDAVLGLAALAAAAAEPIIDWATVANDLFWIRTLLVQQQNALRDALVWGGLAYPPPVLLGVQDTTGNWLPVTDLTPNVALPGANVPVTQGVPLCKSNGLTSGQTDVALIKGSYPRSLDQSLIATPFADLNFASFPITVGAEAATTDNVVIPNLYPNAFIRNGLPVVNGGVMTPPPIWPTLDKPLGDAVANAVQIIAAGANGLPDYNLDADRGYGWQTWDPDTGSNPFNPPVAVMHEA